MFNVPNNRSKTGISVRFCAQMFFMYFIAKKKYLGNRVSKRLVHLCEILSSNIFYFFIAKKNTWAIESPRDWYISVRFCPTTPHACAGNSAGHVESSCSTNYSLFFLFFFQATPQEMWKHPAAQTILYFFYFFFRQLRRTCGSNLQHKLFFIFFIFFQATPQDM